VIGVFDDLDDRLTAALVRMLDSDPALTKDEALTRIERVAVDGGLPEARPKLRRVADRVVRHAVLHPGWLQERGFRTFGFLANVRPGMLEQLIRQSEQVRTGVSHYVVYGSWDTIVLLHGTAAESHQLHSSLAVGANDEPAQITVENVVMAYRQIVPQLRTSYTTVTQETANALVEDFDAPESSGDREQLLKSGHILGSTWMPADANLYPVEAFVGLSLRGRSPVGPVEVLELLLRHDALRQTLVHVFQIRQGWPFHYFLKLCCLNMLELDEATNAIGATTRGDVRFEGLTLVVASGTEQFPMFRDADVTGLPLGPDLTSMVQAGERVFARLPADHQVAFNQLDEDRQITAVKSLAQLGDRLDAAALSVKTRARLESALSTFSRECILNAAEPNLTGAATEVATTIEGELKRLLSRLGHAVYGRNMSRLQTELRLPTKVVRNLTLAKVVQALQAAQDHTDFKQLSDLIDEVWLERVDRFVDARNRWAHDAVGGNVGTQQLIDEAHRTIMEAIELADWIEERLALLNEASEPPVVAADPTEPAALDLAATPIGRDLGVFISHASGDKATVERIAMGLKAFGHKSWYSEWELQTGDSIVTRIEAALARSDTLLVVLSQKSVVSQWVRRELNTALMTQLSGGHDIEVIPVIIEDCEIPPLLRDIFYVDLRSNFEEGLLKLLEKLRLRKERASAG